LFLFCFVFSLNLYFISEIIYLIVFILLHSWISQLSLFTQTCRRHSLSFYLPFEPGVLDFYFPVSVFVVIIIIVYIHVVYSIRERRISNQLLKTQWLQLCGRCVFLFCLDYREWRSRKNAKGYLFIRRRLLLARDSGRTHRNWVIPLKQFILWLYISDATGARSDRFLPVYIFDRRRDFG
jgi:hypothetical protein